MSDSQDSVVAFARARNPDHDFVEVRLNLPKEIVLWLDAESCATNVDRGPLITAILDKWKTKVAHEHIVRQRIVGSNPTSVDSGAHQ